MFKRIASSLLLVGALGSFPIAADAAPRDRDRTTASDQGQLSVQWVWATLVRLLDLDGGSDPARDETSEAPRALWGADEGSPHNDPNG